MCFYRFRLRIDRVWAVLQYLIQLSLSDGRLMWLRYLLEIALHVLSQPLLVFGVDIHDLLLLFPAVLTVLIPFEVFDV